MAAADTHALLRTPHRSFRLSSVTSIPTRQQVDSESSRLQTSPLHMPATNHDLNHQSLRSSIYVLGDHGTSFRLTTPQNKHTHYASRTMHHAMQTRNRVDGRPKAPAVRLRDFRFLRPHATAPCAAGRRELPNRGCVYIEYVPNIGI